MALVSVSRYAIAEMRRSGEWQAHLERVGEAIAEQAAANAIMESYKRSIQVEVREDGDDVVCRVGTDDPFAHLDEWGSINNSPSGAMRRGVESLGLEADFS